MTEQADPRAALDAVGHTQERLADRMHWPFWRHLAVGVLMGVMMFGQTLPNSQSIWASVFVVFASLALVRDDRRRHGTFVSGMRKGRTVPAVLMLLALALSGVFVVRSVLPEPEIEQPAFWIVLVVVVAGTTALSLWWQSLYQAELRGKRA